MRRVEPPHSPVVNGELLAIREPAGEAGGKIIVLRNEYSGYGSKQCRLRGHGQQIVQGAELSPSECWPPVQRNFSTGIGLLMASSAMGNILRYPVWNSTGSSTVMS